MNASQDSVASHLIAPHAAEPTLDPPPRLREIPYNTSGPSCLQGLSRYDDDAGTSVDYVVVEMARHVLGPQWLETYVRQANSGGIERVLV